VMAAAPARQAIGAARVGIAADGRRQRHLTESRLAKRSAQARGSRARAPYGQPLP
jgi:hypothetical protein